MASQLVFRFITDNSKLNKGLGDARKQLSALERTTQSVGRSINRALGAVGVGLGLTAAITGLKEATRAAGEDAKSQAILADQMRNVVRANDAQIAGAEEFIATLQRQTAILDDNLRPAFSRLIQSTGDQTRAQELLSLATDIAAGTGKDLNTVAIALGKAYNGNVASLSKLGIKVKDASNFTAELETRYKGLAQTAANNDPFARINVIFADIQEQLGSALLPYLEQFANYLASPEGVRQTKEIVQVFSQMINELGRVLQFLFQNGKQIAQMAITVGVLRGAWGALNLAVAAYSFVVKGATIATQGLKAALVSTGVGAVAVALGSLASTFMTVDEQTQEATDSMNGYADAIDGVGDSINNLPVSPTNDLGTKPLNPKPGEVYTWFNYSDKKNPNLAVWWTQTWTGTKWTTPKKMSYDAGNGAPTSTSSNPAMQAELDRLNSMADQIRNAGKRFRDAFDLSSGLNETGDVFNVETALAKVRKIVAAAKKVPGLLKQLKAKGASPSMLTEIFGLGPVGAQATASALLKSESLGEFIKAEQTLTVAGQNAGVIAGQSAGTKSYSININKANMTAEEIIAAIKAYEKKTGTKVVFGG